MDAASGLASAPGGSRAPEYCNPWAATHAPRHSRVTGRREAPPTEFLSGDLSPLSCAGCEAGVRRAATAAQAVGITRSGGGGRSTRLGTEVAACTSGRDPAVPLIEGTGGPRPEDNYRVSDPVVVAMGGHSLIDPRLPPTVENQFAVTARAVVPIAELIGRGVRLVLTHGNGPQVGYMQLRVELARPQLHAVPLDSLVADSQGALGYMIQRDLREALRRRGAAAEVAALVTEVEVDPDDPAFGAPSKPIGPFYRADEARRLTDERGWKLVDEAGRGFRRVVPSPTPLRIVQLDTIVRLVSAGVTVITCGGGGIPVGRGRDGSTCGLEAVIDKDHASVLLALGLGARRMFITTAVDGLYRDFPGDRSTRIARITRAELAALAADRPFPAGSMGPKVDAALRFLACGGEEVTLCAPDALVEAFEGRAGTRIANA